MSDTFSRDVMQIVVAKISKQIGWNSVHMSTLEVLTDILQKYIKDLAIKTHKYSELFGRTDPNLNDLGLAFKDMKINIKDIEEYIDFVKPPKFPVKIPLYPVKKESHLNPLRPGNCEVITRPLHIHEHLPPMYPELENNSDKMITKKRIKKSPDSNLFSSSLKSTSFTIKSPNNECLPKKNNLQLKEIGQPLREIKSVIMTTSGYLSSGVEGKLPESGVSSMSLTNSLDYSHSSYETYRTPLFKNKSKKKKKKDEDKSNNNLDKHKSKKEKKRRKPKLKLSPIIQRKNIETNNNNVKKLVTMKELAKLSVFKAGASKFQSKLNH